jgi:hypothetical protein
VLTARRYMIIKNLVPAENCDAVARDMLQLLGWAKDDPSTWYTYHGGAMRGGTGSDDPSGNGGGTMLNMWQTQVCHSRLPPHKLENLSLAN